MKISSAFPSKWLKASDLQGREVTVTIDHCELEAMKEQDGEVGDAKPVLYFQGKSKGLVLNKTNSAKIAAAYGDDTDSWEAKPIILYPDMTSFNGQMVPCLRVRIPASEAGTDELPPF